jgi:hypothetical protein
MPVLSMRAMVLRCCSAMPEPPRGTLHRERAWLRRRRSGGRHLGRTVRALLVLVVDQLLAVLLACRLGLVGAV